MADDKTLRDAPMEFTGERFTPECVREIHYEHWHRYAFALGLASGCRVLDLACGEGYGTDLLAGRAEHVVGVDVDADTITHARRRYRRKNLEFTQASATEIPFADDTFNLVVSFETLEHLAEQETMLAEFRRVLAGDGLLVISSPDKAVYSDQVGFENEYHVRELYRPELEDLLKEQFPAVHLLGQKLMFHSCLWSLGDERPDRTAVLTLEEEAERQPQITRTRVPDGSPVYFIAVCASRADLLPEIASLQLFADRQESVYQHYYHEIRKNMSAGELIQQRDAEIRALKRQLADARRD